MRLSQQRRLAHDYAIAGGRGWRKYVDFDSIYLIGRSVWWHGPRGGNAHHAWPMRCARGKNFYWVGALALTWQVCAGQGIVTSSCRNALPRLLTELVERTIKIFRCGCQFVALALQPLFILRQLRPLCLEHAFDFGALRATQALAGIDHVLRRQGTAELFLCQRELGVVEIERLQGLTIDFLDFVKRHVGWLDLVQAPIRDQIGGEMMPNPERHI